MYSMDIQVRYSEVDLFGKVKLHQILEYFQDCVTAHSMAVGFGITGDIEENKGWYLLAWDIQIKRYPKILEKITITTEPYAMRGFYGYRKFRILDEQKNVLVDADSNWIYMDIEKKIPVKIPDFIVKKYIPEKVEETMRVKRKLSAKGEWKEREQFVVPKIFLDSNRHVNNTYYVLWAEDVLPENYSVQEVKIDYRQSAFLNDTIHIYTIEENGEWRIRFLNQENTLIALLEMKGTYIK